MRTAAGVLFGGFVWVACGGVPASPAPPMTGGGDAAASGPASSMGGGSAGGASAGGTGGGAGGGSLGTPVTITATTATTPIPANSMACSGATLGSKADLEAVNLPLAAAGVSVSTLTLRYEMGSYFGEPTRRAVASWTGSGALSSIGWLAEVQSPSGRQYVNAAGARVFASFQTGSFRGPGAGFGVDTTGSPAWSQTFVTWDPAAGQTVNGVTDIEAKGIYRNCFQLANMRLYRLNGRPALLP